MIDEAAPATAPPPPALHPWVPRGMAVVAGVLFGSVLALVQALTAPPPVLPPPVRAAPSPAGDPARERKPDRDAEFRRLVDFGDRCYDDAVPRLKKSDPAEHPATWEAEHDAALELLERAVDYYNQALEIRETQRLVERIKDANAKRIFARKRKLGP